MNFLISSSWKLLISNTYISLSPDKSIFEKLSPIFPAKPTFNPDFFSREKRKENRLRLKAEIETVLTKKSAKKWIEELNKIGVPAGPVLSIPEILKHPQILNRGLISEIHNTPNLEKKIKILKSAIIFDGQHPETKSTPPSLGADNNQIYLDLGYDESDIKVLEEEGVIWVT